MCECPGFINTHDVVCEGCDEWRKQRGIRRGQECSEHIGKKANQAGHPLCHYCWQAHVKHARQTGTPPFPTTPPQPPQPPQGLPQVPWPPVQPALPPTVADAASQSSGGSQQQQMPPPAAAVTHQLNDICARLDALEGICERLEAMMVSIISRMDAMEAGGPQPQVLQAMPPGMPQGAAAATAALAPPHPQAAPSSGSTSSISGSISGSTRSRSGTWSLVPASDAKAAL